MTDDQKYASTIFFKAALPLAKVIAEDRPELGKAFEGKTCVLQVSAIVPEVEGGKLATHFEIVDGVWTTKLTVHESPDVELEFGNIQKFIDFMAGRKMIGALPKMKGMVKKMGLFFGFLKILLKMANLLQATDYPKAEEDRHLLVKLYFYLLAGGISALNKAGHPEIHDWALKSPDRAYAFSVKGEGNEDLASYIRVKAGKSKYCKGYYTRSKPFFCMRFACVDSALGILMQKADMLEYTAEGKLIMEGAPEFGAQLGNFMMIIGGYAK